MTTIALLAALTLIWTWLDIRHSARPSRGPVRGPVRLYWTA